MRGFFVTLPLAAAASLVGQAILSAAGPAEPAAFPGACELRVESELFAGGGEEPVARTLTLFHAGVAWDFLELPPADEPAAMELAEIVLHDPARERVVVIDPRRGVKTEIPLVRLERLSVSLARWARSSEDRLVRWAGGPDFSEGLTVEEDRLELAGPRVRYAVAHVAAPSPEAAGSYRRFADTAILLKALLHPGGVPPFPRLDLNRRLEAAGAIPSEVLLEVDPRLAAIAAGGDRLRCVHKSHPRLLAADERRLDEARGALASARAVDLAAFAAPGSAAEAATTPLEAAAD